MNTDMPGKRDGYSGFLAMECSACGRIREFFTRTSLTRYECPCGQREELAELLPAYAECKCGRNWKYLTNRRAMRLTLHCVACDSPIETEINKRGTAFVTMSMRDAAGARKGRWKR